VIGSLAAAYHLFTENSEALVRTKDIDCLLVPRVEALRAGKSVAEALLASGWRRPTEGPYATPGTAATRDDQLPVVRLYPPDSRDWYIELLSILDASDERDRVFDRVALIDGSHYAVASFRHLDIAAHEPVDTPQGLRCARLEMLALSSLLRNPTIRPERMLAPAGGWGPRRSNKDLGRVLTVSRLVGRDAVGAWPAAFAAALENLYSVSWRELASRVGGGIRALLASDGDLREALEISRAGLLAHVPTNLDEFRIVAERFLVDAIEPLEKSADQQ
jgi:hypothetical protein